MKKRIAVIVKREESHSRNRWLEESEKGDFDIDFIHIVKAQLILGNEGGSMELFVDGKRYEEKVDAVYRTSQARAAVLIENYFIDQGATHVWENRMSPFRYSWRKLFMYQLLAENEVRIPRTVFLSNRAQLEKALQSFNATYPLVVKVDDDQASQDGVGVIRIDSQEALYSTCDFLFQSQRPILMQEYIDVNAGRDVRVTVLDGAVLGAASRDSKGKDFRSNHIHGAVSESVAPTKAQEQIAIAAVKAVGARFGSVDLIGSDDEPVVTEVNNPANFFYVEEHSGVNIVAAVVKALLS